MIFLVEFDVHDGQATSKKYVSTHGISTGPNDTPANQYYEPRMASVGRIERSMFGSGDGVSGGTTNGKSEVGFGNISVLNGTSHGLDELIDHWKDLAFRQVVIRSLNNESQPFAQAATRFIGSVEQLVSTNALEQYDIVIHDRLQNIDKPLLVNTYLGTTSQGGLGTVEGDVDLKDVVKQKVWGTVHNCAVTDVNHYDLIWQVSDGPVVSILVYDGGVLLVNDGDTATLASLFATPVEGGHYTTCCSLGLFRTGVSPVGTVTADVVEGATAADRTAAQIARRMLAWFAEMYDETLTLSSNDVLDLDDLNSAECGIVVRDTESAIDAMMRVLNSVGAWMLPQSNSPTMYNVGRFDPPDDEPVASYDLEDSIGGNPQRVESGDESKGVPAWRVTVRYDQLDTVQQSSDLFGEVTENDPIRTQYLGIEWRQAIVENEAVLTVWPNAPTIQVDTRLVSQADAEDEAERLLEIYGVKRDIWRLVVPMSDDPQDDPGVGEVVELTSRAGRMGLGPEPGEGETFRCLGRIDDFDDVPVLTLTLWGAATLVAVALRITGRLVASETTDTAALTGSIPISITGTLAATGAADTASFAGSIVTPVTGTLVATEAVDTASFVGSVTSLDSATSAWISAVVAAGGSVSSGRQTLVNALIAGLKTDGVWAKLDRLWVYAAENRASALIDLVALDVASAVNSPTFTADRGYAGNGSSSYIDTTFNASTQGVNWTLNSANISAWDNTSRANDSSSITGCFDGANVSDIIPFIGTSLAARINGGGLSGIVTGFSQGFFSCQRTASSVVDYIYNGTSLGTVGDASSAIVNLPFFVCGRNDGGGFAAGTTDQVSMVSYGGKLSGTEAGNYYTRLRTYMTAVGVP